MMTACNNYMAGNTTILMRVKQAPPCIPNTYLTARMRSAASGFRKKYRTDLSVEIAKAKETGAEALMVVMPRQRRDPAHA